MSKPHLWALGLFCLWILACGPAPAPAVPAPPPQASVPVARVDPEAAPVEPIDDGSPGPLPVGSADPQWGRRDALVTIVEFADFQCPFCAHVQMTLRQLREAYGPEKLRIVWKNNPLPFHANARPSAVAAMMLFERFGDEAFWTAHDAFYSEPRRLDELPAQVAERLGLRSGELAAPTARRNAEAKIEADMALGKEAGVTGTPAFFLNGVFLSGAQPYDKFSAIVDDQIKKATEALARGTPRRRLYSELAAAQWHKEPQKPASPAKPEPEDLSVWRIPVGKSAVRGRADAPVTIVELADYQCPFCGRVEVTITELRRIYGDKVRVVYKHNPLPFHPRAEPASELALEARAQQGDKAFWTVHDLLYHKECAGSPAALDKPSCEANGGTWVDNQIHLDDSDLLGYARSAGLDVDRVRAAIASKKHKAEIDADQDLADDLQASGTPHFFINGRRLVGAQPLDKFKAVVDEELAKAEALIKGGIRAAKVYEAIQAAGKVAPPPEKKTVPAPTRDNPSRGPAGAKVVVQFFSDFQCPFCKRVVPTVEELEKAFPGKIRLVWRNLPLPMHPDAEPAAEAAMEAFAQKGSAGFFAMYELLYAAQGQPGALERPALERYAAQLGLDPARFSRALDTQAHKALIDADHRVADDAGITGTPAFVINGYYLSGAQPFSKFKNRIQRALAEAR
jgi:protein-disulfide isomerase